MTILLIFGLTLSIALYIHNFNKPKQQHKAPLPVVTAAAHNANIPIYLSALGSILPTSKVTVKSQVSGQLVGLLYHEGQKINKGDLLAEIDQRPFAAQLLQYQGQLERDMALLSNAKKDLARYQRLFKQDSISKQTLDTQKSLVEQYIGTIKLDQGQIENAKLNLDYCKITAPISGQIGLRLIDAGNLVQAADTNGLVVINTVNPITAIFSIPEDNLQDVLQQTNAGNILIVEAYDRNQDHLLATGKLLSIDNQIDSATGTIKLRAEFANENNLLFPNQFVNIKLLVKTLPNVVAVPTAALQHGVNKTFVYLLNNFGKEQSVTITPVEIATTYQNDTAISSGLKSGDVVVIEGADKLTDGAKVIISDQENTSKMRKV